MLEVEGGLPLCGSLINRQVLLETGALFPSIVLTHSVRGCVCEVCALDEVPQTYPTLPEVMSPASDISLVCAFELALFAGVPSEFSVCSYSLMCIRRENVRMPVL